MMFTVIDTIVFQSGWTHRYPEFAERGDGIIAILDPHQIQEAPQIQGLTITVRKPNGRITRIVASSSEVHHSVVGIFFSDASGEDVPRGAQLEW